MNFIGTALIRMGFIIVYRKKMFIDPNGLVSYGNFFTCLDLEKNPQLWMDINSVIGEK